MITAVAIVSLKKTIEPDFRGVVRLASTVIHFDVSPISLFAEIKFIAQRHVI